MQTSRIFIGCKNSYQEQIFSALIAGCGVQANILDNALKTNLDLPLSPQLVIADLAYFQERNLSVATFATTLAAKHPGCKLLLQNGNTWLVSDIEKAWASSFGVKHLLPRLSARRFEATLLPLAQLISQTTGLLLSVEKVKSFLSMLKSSERNEAMELIVLEKLDQQHTDLIALSHAISEPKGFKVADRTWRFKKFPQVLQGDEAAEWLSAKFSLSAEQAVCLGEILRRSRSFEHVAQEHAFKNQELYYHFVSSSEAREIVVTKNVLSNIAGKDGFDIADRAYLATEYSDCFIGKDAVDWLVERYRCSRKAAVQIGQMLADLGYISHVTKEHEFKDAALFYQLRGIKLAQKSVNQASAAGRVIPAPA